MIEDLIKKINSLEKSVNLLLDLHLQQSNNLTTYNDVAKFLGKTRKTVYNYIKEEKLLLNEHYHRDDNNKIVFIPSAIIEFKSGVKTVDTEVVKKQLEDNQPKRVNNPIVNSLLQGVA